ncbi:MAG: phytoene desaturase family protein [Phycisphaerae bacterium]
MTYDTVVIGSGASGMCTALALARHGQRVALVEQDDELAPLLRRFCRDGWWCDPGLHYVGGLSPSGPLAVIFRYLALDTLVEPLPLDRDAYDIVQVGDAEPIRFPVGPLRVQETLIRHYPRSERAIKAYLDAVQAVHRETPFLGFDHPASLLRSHMHTPTESLATSLATYGAEEALQDMLSEYGFCLYGMHGDECPMMVHAMVLGSFFFSAHTFARGGDEVVDAFKRRINEAGAAIYSGQRASRLVVDRHRRVCGVQLDGGGQLRCEACVCTVHPHRLAELLPAQSIRKSFMTRVRWQENTPGLFTVYLGLDDTPKELGRSNRYFIDAPCEPAGARAIYVVPACGDGGNGLEPKSLAVISVQSAGSGVGKSMRGGCGAADAGVPTNHVGGAWARDKTYEYMKHRATEKTVEAFYLRFPELRGKCRVLDSATPCTYESYTGTVGGSAYGMKQSVAQAGLMARTPLSGLYLAGQSVLAPGLLGVLISGLLAVSEILGAETVWEGLQKCR